MAASRWTTVLDVVEGVAEMGANWLIQSTLLLAGGLAFGWYLRRRGSAAQSAAYRTTLVAVFVCPLATWGLGQLGFSGWSVRFSPGWMYALSAPAAVTLPAAKVEAPAPLPTVQLKLPAPQLRATPLAKRDAFPAAIVDRENAPIEPPAAPTPASSGLEPSSAADLSPVAATLRVRRAGMLALATLVAWAVVAALLLVRLAWAWRRIGQLRIRAHRADEPALRICRKLATELRVQPPDVLVSPFLPSPCLTGMLRPAVMLPDGELKLPLRDVLIHELAHLKRRDCHWNLFRQLATAVCFFQPLSWLLSRRLEFTAEEVCDDFVVQCGGDRADYAHRLVDIAELGSLRMAAAGVGIVSLRSMLARRVARIMDTSRSLSTRPGNLLLAIVVLAGTGGAMLAGFVGLGEPIVAESRAIDAEQDDPATNDSKRAATAAEPAATDHDLITIRGRVVDPQGKMFAGADVYALRWYWNFGKPAPLAKVKSNDAGVFEISYRKSQFNDPGGRPEQWREVYIAAAAEGFGPGWIGYEDIEAGREPVVRLAVDDMPIEGRIVDLEGNPVSGARIEVGEIMAGNNGDLSPWIEAIGIGQSLAAAGRKLDDGLPLFAAGRWPSVVTDAEGRFHMTGVGRERAIRLHVKHPALVTSSIQVVTRPMEPISHPAFEFPGSHDNTVFGAKFEFAAAPSRTIQGTVRDAETGEPIAGVGVWSDKFAGQNISGFHSIKVKSDEQGRYRLEGMPKGEGNRLVAVPAELPYFTASKDVPDPPGIEPVEFDIEMHRGVWVTGRVIDKATGRGVPSALMHYVPFPDNKRAAELPEFEDNSHIMTVQDRYGTQADGSYRVVALPGRGIVCVKSVREAYPSAQGFKEIAELKDREGFMKYGSAFAPSEKFPTAVKEVNIEDDAEVVCNFELDPGRRVKLRAVDSSGEPLEGVEVAGSRSIGDHYKEFSTPDVEILAMRDDERRTVLVYHRERRLGKALHVDASQAGEAPVTVRLEPCATVKGRLVDGNGAPINGASIRVDVYRDGDYGQRLESSATDAEGRFSHDGLLAGLPYSLTRNRDSIGSTSSPRNSKWRRARRSIWATSTLRARSGPNRSG